MLTPSDNLRSLLAELQLCDAQQLAACEPEVRRLAGDLPGFDSCWLDVLTAHRLLTPWQARCLQSSDPLEMRQGPYRLREPLGQRTWQAETTDRSRLLVLSQLKADDLHATRLLMERAQLLVESVWEAGAAVSSAVCLPREFLLHEHGDGGWLASPYIPGWQLDELLIRGGRLPWQVVAEIGRGILRGICELEQAGFVHGDISLRNIRLQADGRVVLVDPFTARLLKPAVGFRADLKLREIQHCAPEQVGSGRRCDSVSDLYSLGTVLWQLMTSRPTSISADPVTFLMQCRDRDVDDVRRWVPDSPAGFSRAIQGLTRRRPELRPPSAAAALESWSQLAGNSVAATRTLLRCLPDRRQASLVPRPTLSRRRLLKPVWAATALTGCVMVGLSSHLIPLPLNLTRTPAVTSIPVPEAIRESDVTAPPVVRDETLPLPEVSPDGVIQLTAGQVYSARSLQQPGTLRIHAGGDALAVVEVPDDTVWKITADQLQLTGIQIRSQREGTGSSRRLLDVRSRLLELDRAIVGRSTGRRATGLRWSPLAEGSSVIRVRNTVFLADRFAIHTTAAPGRFELENVLFDSSDTAWRCDVRQADRVQLTMNQVTQLDGSSFADVIHRSGSEAIQVELICGESVLMPREAVVRLASMDAHWTADSVRTAFRLPGRANPVIMRPTAVPVVWLDPSLRQKVAVADSQVLSESLLMADPEFDSSAAAETSFAGARLVDFDGPKRGAQLPGVDVTLLPQLPETTGGD